MQRCYGLKSEGVSEKSFLRYNIIYINSTLEVMHTLDSHVLVNAMTPSSVGFPAMFKMQVQLPLINLARFMQTHSSTGLRWTISYHVVEKQALGVVVGIFLGSD